MAIVAIGAIGTFDYTETKYRFSEEETYTSSYPIHALIQREKIAFDKTVILLTDKARRTNWDMMKVYLEGSPNAGQICDVTIEDGKNEEELWAIFDKIVDNVRDGDELYIDITQGLRHLPVLLLIACAYLRAARKVMIKSISYGALELGTRNENRVVTECAVFELLPYVALFDWSSGVRAFQRSGDAGVLAGLLRVSAASANELDDQVAQTLKNVADRLDSTTLALELARPEEASTEIKALTTKLETVQENSKQYAKPFALLKDMINTDFKKITELPAQKALPSIENRLQTQRNLIVWYEGKNRLALAVQLTREWLVSKYMVQQNKIGEIENRTVRETMADELRNNRAIAPELHDAFVAVANVRNDIAHAGQTNRKKKAKDLQTEIRQIFKSLRSIK